MGAIAAPNRTAVRGGTRLPPRRRCRGDGRQRAFEQSAAGHLLDPEKARDFTPFRVTERVQQRVWGSLGDYDRLPHAGRITGPTLVVHGREDPIPPPSSGALVAAMPDAWPAVPE